MPIPTEQPFVPLILGGDIGGYSLAREFHEQYGVRSVAVVSVVTGLVAHSSVVDPVVYADQQDESRFLDFLEDLITKLSADGARKVLLLASNDPHTRLIVTHRQRLGRHAVIPYPDLDVMLEVTSKEGFLGMCQELGVPTPATAVLHASTADPAGSVREAGITYPAIVKASDSVAWHDVEFEGQQKVHVAQDEAELEKLVGAASAAGYDAGFVVQDLIPGPDSGMHLVTFFVDREGRTRFAAPGRVVVEEHAPGALGNSAAIVSGSYPELVSDGRKLIESIRWQGFGMFDVKFDPRDGRYKFFELNPRLGRNHFYVTAAGNNVARFYVEEFMGQGLQQQEELVVSTDEHLYSVLPARLLKRYVPDDLRGTVSKLLKRGGHSHPLVYSKERSPKRWLYITQSLVNQFRKFRRWHPAP